MEYLKGSINHRRLGTEKGGYIWKKRKLSGFAMLSEHIDSLMYDNPGACLRLTMGISV